MRPVATQAAAAHSCWPGSKMLVTGNPSTVEPLPLGQQDGDDVDIWAVLSRRYYGQYDEPRDRLATIEQAGAPARVIWSSTYSGAAGHSRLQRARAAVRPADVPALERARGDPGHALRAGHHLVLPGRSVQQPAVSGGEYVLVYPGEQRPIASARLEQIRDGIEDWGMFDIVRRKRGADGRAHGSSAMPASSARRHRA